MSELHLSPTLRRILLEALILCGVAFAIGISLNYPLIMNAFTGKTVAAPIIKKNAADAPKVGAGPIQEFPELVELDEIDELLSEGALLVDARNIDDYKAGHLYSAVSLPLVEVSSKLASFVAQVPKEQILILYCNGFGCPDSFDLGLLLLKERYQHVLVYEGGFPQWRDDGRKIEEGMQ